MPSCLLALPSPRTLISHRANLRACECADVSLTTKYETSTPDLLLKPTKSTSLTVVLWGRINMNVTSIWAIVVGFLNSYTISVDIHTCTQRVNNPIAPVWSHLVYSIRLCLSCPLLDWKHCCWTLVLVLLLHRTKISNAVSLSLLSYILFMWYYISYNTDVERSASEWPRIASINGVCESQSSFDMVQTFLSAVIKSVEIPHNYCDVQTTATKTEK